MAVELIIGFDGSAPATADCATRDGPGRFTIYPNRRSKPGISEEATGMGSRMSVRLRNSSRDEKQAVVIVDWDGATRTVHHDIGYIRPPRGVDWLMIPGLRDGGITEYRVTLPRGITHLGLYPEYNCQDCLAFIKRLGRKVQVEQPGRSREGRPIYLIRFPSRGVKPATLFVQARDHAYETAGSYCMEGIADFLLSGDALSQYLRSKYTVCMVPMTNPDGVHNGMSRLTHETGADMNRLLTAADPAHVALKAAIDAVRPDVHMNVHNWTDKFKDGLLVNEQMIADGIRRLLPDDTMHYKYWSVETRGDWLAASNQQKVPEAAMSWKDYCLERFGASCVTFEFPWFMLDARAMRKKGAGAFVALALAVIGERSL